MVIYRLELLAGYFFTNDMWNIVYIIDYLQLTVAVLVAPATDLWIKTASASVQEAPLPSAVVAVVVAAAVAMVIVVRRKVSCPLLFAKMYMYIFAQLAFCFYKFYRTYKITLPKSSCSTGSFTYPCPFKRIGRAMIYLTEYWYLCRWPLNFFGCWNRYITEQLDLDIWNTVCPKT